MNVQDGNRPSAGKRIMQILLPAALILAWLAAAAIGGPYFGRVDEVSTNDNTTYLPESAEATEVQDRLADYRDADTLPAIVVVSSDTNLNKTELAQVDQTVESLKDNEGVHDEVSPAIASEDGKAAQAFIPIDSEADTGAVVEEIRSALADDLDETLTSHVTGPAGFSADLVAGFSGIDGLLLAVALSAVFLILLVVYRSFLLPLLVLMTSMFALCVALLTVWWLARAELLVLTGQTQGILFILVIGAATDYALLYTARYREELRRNADRGAATRAALKGSLEPITASGGTVIAGLLCLLLSDLGSNKSLGPVAAIGIAFAMLAALSLLPALLFACGRTAYWPRRPRFEPDHAEEDVTQSGGYARIGRMVRRRPRTVWIVCTLLLLVCAGFAVQMDADGVPQSQLVLGASDARDGQDELAEHFAAGSGTPAYVLTAEDDYRDTAVELLDNNRVESVDAAADTASGSVRLGDDGEPQVGPGGKATEPTVSRDEVLLQATLTVPTDSAAAESTIRQLRADLDVIGIGGTTATAVDTTDTATHDRNLIIPVVLLVILLILMMLLRSILAPVLLIATTVVSFGTAMGVSALMFEHVFDFPGADASVPLYGFVFLVALGIDYNIFLMTRVREEALLHGTGNGIHRGLAVTGGVITSAGIVLAATFAALAVIPILFLAQIAFIVAFGVLLDTFVVRTLLVPALGFDFGRAIWWPAKKPVN